MPLDIPNSLVTDNMYMWFSWTENIYFQKMDKWKNYHWSVQLQTLANYCILVKTEAKLQQVWSVWWGGLKNQNTLYNDVFLDSNLESCDSRRVLMSEGCFRPLAFPRPQEYSRLSWVCIEQLEELQALTPQWRVPVAPIISVQPWRPHPLNNHVR